MATYGSCCGEGLLTRGPESATWQKVNGHATMEHIRNGLATEATKAGNDAADNYATRGISEHQQQAVNLAKWLTSRQDRYLAFMERIHKVIIAVLVKEKDERTKAEAAKAFVMGYDPEKYEFVTCKLPEDDPQGQTISLEMVPPVTGIHSYMKQQPLYQCIHRFLKESRWTTLRQDDEESGCTWLELFIHFDTLGWRTENAAFTTDHAADKRARARREKAKPSNWRKGRRKLTPA